MLCGDPDLTWGRTPSPPRRPPHGCPQPSPADFALTTHSGHRPAQPRPASHLVHPLSLIGSTDRSCGRRRGICHNHTREPLPSRSLQATRDTEGNRAERSVPGRDSPGQSNKAQTGARHSLGWGRDSSQRAKDSSDGKVMRGKGVIGESGRRAWLWSVLAALRCSGLTTPLWP